MGFRSLCDCAALPETQRTRLKLGSNPKKLSTSPKIRETLSCSVGNTYSSRDLISYWSSFSGQGSERSDDRAERRASRATSDDRAERRARPFQNRYKLSSCQWDIFAIRHPTSLTTPTSPKRQLKSQTFSPFVIPPLSQHQPLQKGS